MLDSLSYWDGSSSAVGRAWLSQVLQRHDIARVLEPLLLLLLHPKTHRVSIQRVQAQMHWAHSYPQPADPGYVRDLGPDGEYALWYPLVLYSHGSVFCQLLQCHCPLFPIRIQQAASRWCYCRAWACQGPAFGRHGDFQPDCEPTE